MKPLPAPAGLRPAEPGLFALFLYGLPALPIAALSLPLYIYVPTYYSANLGLSLVAVGEVLLAARLIDALADPVIGWASDRVRSPLGRRRTVLAFAAPIVAISALMVMVPPIEATALYLFCWGTLLSVGTTLAMLSYSAWGAELSGTYHGRNRIVAAREVAIVFGTLIATALPTALGMIGIRSDGVALAAIALLVGLGLPIATIAALAGVGEPPDYTRRHVPLFEGLKEMARNGPFVRLMFAFFLNALSIALPATLFLFFVSQRLEAPDARGPLLFLYFISGIAALPVWLWLSRRYEKHRAWCMAMATACLAFIWVPLLGPGDLEIFVAICAITGAALGADLLLPNSIQADVVDVDTADSGEQRTGFYFAIWALVNKLALAAAVGVSFPLLQFAGFDPQAGTSSADGLLVLALLYGLAPVLLKLAAFAVMWHFPLGAAEQAALRTKIETGG